MAFVNVSSTPFSAISIASASRKCSRTGDSLSVRFNARNWGSPRASIAWRFVLD